MSLKEIFDDGGNALWVKEYKGKRYPYAVPGSIDVHLNGIKNLACRDDDIIIMGHPRCGNHWNREIISMLMRREASYMKSDSVIDAPIEVMEIDHMNKLESPRVFWTHLEFDELPDDFIKRRCKIVCAIRNPKDAFVSFYFILQKYKDIREPRADVYKGTMEDFMHLYVKNEIPFENWFLFYEKLQKALKNIPDYPFMMVKFEDLKKDTVGQLRKMAEFLEVPCTEQLLLDITEKVSFKNLKKEKAEKNAEYAKTISSDGSEIYYRKGTKFVSSGRICYFSDFATTYMEVKEDMGKKNNSFLTGDIGDWKNHFTVALNERFEAFFAKELQDPNFKYRDMYSTE